MKVRSAGVLLLALAKACSVLVLSLDGAMALAKLLCAPNRGNKLGKQANHN